jgi:hypothetical protein
MPLNGGLHFTLALLLLSAKSRPPVPARPLSGSDHCQAGERGAIKEVWRARDAGAAFSDGRPYCLYDECERHGLVDKAACPHLELAAARRTIHTLVLAFLLALAFGAPSLPSLPSPLPPPLPPLAVPEEPRPN